MNKLVSPCIAICELDSASQVCIGCGRTSDEIALWRCADDTEKTAILASAELRLKTITAATNSN